MPGRNDFFERVWLVVKEVPEGRVTTYGAVARFLGAAKSSRSVGFAMNASHSAPTEIPAHRVVNRKGVLTGKHHFQGMFEMEERLKAEGVEIEDDRVVRFQELFWDPNEHLSL